MWVNRGRETGQRRESILEEKDMAIYNETPHKEWDERLVFVPEKGMTHLFLRLFEKKKSLTSSKKRELKAQPPKKERMVRWRVKLTREGVIGG